ncbi:MAG: hypothetical protein WBA74_22570 [Cyclobacteriaceae bacterium]
MTNSLSWSMNLFGTSFEVKNNRGSVGRLKLKPLSSVAEGFIGSKEYRFKPKGIFSTKVEVWQIGHSLPVAHIRYGTWGRKALITIDQKQYTWKYENIWQTKWSLRSNDVILIQSKDNSMFSKGTIESGSTDQLLVLICLYVKKRIDMSNSYA